jgi:hypothetical protein
MKKTWKAPWHCWRADVPRETTYFPVTDNPHGAALAVLAVLAYPGNTADRDSFIAAGRAWILRQLPKGPERDALAARLPAIRLRDIDKRLERGFKRIRTRRQWAAAELQQEFLRGMIHRNPRTGRKARVTALAALSARNRNDRNAYARIWRESLPVLHLAYVLQMGEALADWRREKATAEGAVNLREKIRLANLTRQRGPARDVRINLRIDYSTPTHALDLLALIARPGWVAPALAEAENVRRHLLASGTVADRESIALLPK